MSIAEKTDVAPTALAGWLAAVESSASGADPIEVVETALSWVLLTGRHAYKIKKAVQLGEAHFRSLASRRQACAEEVRLNRRLARGVYLGIVPLTRDASGELRLGGCGEAVEWAVKMRRLRGNSNLLWLIEHDQLARRHITALSAVLANFYFGSPPETDVLDDLCTRLRKRVDDVGVDVPSRLPVGIRRTFQRIAAAQHRYLDAARMALNLRVCDGRIVDGHGDLRPEHVFLERQPVIIDCVEYSATRRRSDALDDLGAFVMECLRLERADVADALMSAYRAGTCDEPCSKLEAFYRSLHACARAKSAFALGEADADRSASRLPSSKAESYLAQAERDSEVFG